jgi:hypothetical protein
MSILSRGATLEAQGATVYRNAQEMASAWMRNVRSRSPIMLRSQHVRVATTRGRGSEAQTGSSSFSARFNVRLRRLLYIQPGCRSLLRHHTLCLLLCVLAAHQGGPRHEGSPRPRLIRLLRHHTTVSPLTVTMAHTKAALREEWNASSDWGDNCIFSYRPAIRRVEVCDESIIMIGCVHANAVNCG